MATKRVSTKKAAKKAAPKKSAKKIAVKSASKVSAKVGKKPAKVAQKSVKPASSKKARLVAKAPVTKAPVGKTPAPKTPITKTSMTPSSGQRVTTQVSTTQVPATQVSVGQPVGDFVLPATGGKEIALASLKGKNVVIYFYPKDLTPGCTLEGQDFTRLYPEFSKTNTEVLGVSRDPVGLHEKFKEKEGYCFDLLSDNDGKLTEAFGVWKEKQNYGKSYMGIERSTFFIDANGVLQKEWRGVRAAGHAEEVLSAVKELMLR